MISTTRIALMTSLLLGMSAISARASAQDTDIGQHSTNEVKAFCEGTEGGVYREGSGIYGCKWVRGNGAYGVLCDQDGCFYTTPAKRQSYTGQNALGDITAGKLDATREQPAWLWISLAVLALIVGFVVGRASQSRNRRATVGA